MLCYLLEHATLRMLYGHNPLCKKTWAELLLLEVKSRSHEAPKEALKYKSILNFSFLTHPFLLCCFEVCWFWHGLHCVNEWGFVSHGVLNGGGPQGWLFVFPLWFCSICFCSVTIIFCLFVWCLFSLGRFFSLSYWYFGLPEGTDNEIPLNSACSGYTSLV